MENVSAVTSFILTAYTELEDHRHLYFVCILLAYFLIFFINSVLVFVIYTERGLHDPMYFLICNLAVNGVFGCTCLFPSMLVHLSSHHYEISVSPCLLQVYVVYLYGAVELTILAVMSYDRYAAICHPFHYHHLMSPRKVYTAIALSWVIPGVYIALQFIPTLQRSFCGRTIENFYCENYALLGLSCSDATIQSFVILGTLFLVPGSQIVMILFSYAQILRICLSASMESQLKALQTCTPHLVTLMIYSLGILFSISNNYPQLTVRNSRKKDQSFWSLYLLVIPALCNPVVYGMSIQAIRVQIFHLFMWKKKSVISTVGDGEKLFCLHCSHFSVSVVYIFLFIMFYIMRNQNNLHGEFTFWRFFSVNIFSVFVCFFPPIHPDSFVCREGYFR